MMRDELLLLLKTPLNVLEERPACCVRTWKHACTNLRVFVWRPSSAQRFLAKWHALYTIPWYIKQLERFTAELFTQTRLERFERPLLEEAGMRIQDIPDCAFTRGEDGSIVHIRLSPAMGHGPGSHGTVNVSPA